MNQEINKIKAFVKKQWGVYSKSSGYIWKKIKNWSPALANAEVMKDPSIVLYFCVLWTVYIRNVSFQTKVCKQLNPFGSIR